MKLKVFVSTYVAKLNTSTSTGAVLVQNPASVIGKEINDKRLAKIRSIADSLEFRVLYDKNEDILAFVPRASVAIF